MKLKDAKLLQPGDPLRMTSHAIAQGLQGPRDSRGGQFVTLTKDNLLRVKRTGYSTIEKWALSFWDEEKE